MPEARIGADARGGAALALLSFLLSALLSILSGGTLRGDDLARIRARGELVWGGDQEGGGPYVYPDPSKPETVTGFEVELASLLARELGVKARFFQGPWDNLPALLGTGSIDLILNGYELTGARVARMERSSPYYVYELVLLARKGRTRLRDQDELARAKAPGSPSLPLPRLGVLVNSASHTFAGSAWGASAEVVTYDTNTDPLRDAETGKIDGTLLDVPISIFYRDRYPGLENVGPPVGRGYYVAYLRQGEAPLRTAIDGALKKLLDSGELRALYQRYGIWNGAQEDLPRLQGAGDDALGLRGGELRGWSAILSRGPLLLESAWMTVKLSCLSMPLAMLVGLLVALGRLYGPPFLRWPLVGYVELLRGTPLMLQLYLIFFLLPEVGLRLPAFAAAILGLAVNYSAYESEIYRAGLEAIPRGQMEAALSLGMSRALALRRIIVPQAVRIVIPPVTNDFIALFKDTSVCSVITVVELTKQYSIQRNDTGATIELASLTALLYLLMSLPLSRFAGWMERRLARRPAS